MREVVTTLKLTVVYSGGDAHPDICDSQLDELVRFAAGRGLLTGELDMTVEDFEYETTSEITDSRR